eukprot:7391561-Prymnesium_polylepis.3
MANRRGCHGGVVWTDNTVSCTLAKRNALPALEASSAWTRVMDRMLIAPMPMPTRHACSSM